MSGFGLHSRIRDLVALGPSGRDLLLRHGYNLGEGFVDVLSQYQTLEEAVREGRLRDVNGMLRVLNYELPKVADAV
jgi:hypothetical protein